MTQIGFLLIGAFAIILAILSQQATALKCYQCISGMNKDCGEPFHPEKLHKLDYRDCPWKCGLLMYNTVEGNKTWYRFCAENQADLDQKCTMSNKLSCDTCDQSDGCNSAIKFGPIALFIVIPMFVAKVFFF